MNPASATRKESTRQRIVEVASRAIRRSGFRDVGVADVMKGAGLTHGGFYAHFRSRDALLSAALVQASEEIGSFIRLNVATLSASGVSPFAAFVNTYLSDSLIRDREHGCPVAALCSEMPHQSAPVRASSREIVGNLVKLVEETLPVAMRVELAWAVAATLIGAMQLARSLGDNAEGRAVLAGTRASLLTLYDHP